MAETNISWTDRVWNPVIGCAKVSAGCTNCYAETMAVRLAAMGNENYREVVKGNRWNGRVKFLFHKMNEPLHWKKPCRVFVNSMSDLFHDDVSDEDIARIFGVMGDCPQHVFQVLTKRPARMCQYLTEREKWSTRGTLPNVWLGVSCEDQASAEERIPLLLQCPAAVRWVSLEPLLGRIIPSGDWFPGISWCVIGGETGAGYRKMDLDDFYETENQFSESGCAVYVKQDSGPKPGMQGRLSDDVWNRKEYPR